MDVKKIQLAALQGVLQASGGYKGRVDGIVGPMTRKAVNANKEVAQRAAGVLGGIDIDELVGAVGASKMPVIEIIRNVSKEFGEDPAAWVAKGQIESSLNPSAARGSYKGLFQMGASAWLDADEYLAGVGSERLGRFDANVLDARQNTRAAMAYKRALTRQIRSAGWNGNLSDADYYLAHQQGAGGLVRLKKAAAGNQLPSSSEAAMVAAMQSNPPQDGQGVTTDPFDFLNRWSAVYDERLASALS